MYKSILTVLSFACTCFLFAFQAGDLASSIKRGEEVYVTNCMNCHMQNGEGLEGTYPTLVKADFLLKDKDGKNAIGVILNGQSGELTVNGKTYNAEMPVQSYLPDDQVADVLNYVRNSWGNKGKAITPAMVKALRK